MRRILLDTNVILWALEKDTRLKQSASGLLIDPTSTLYLSIASIWEISIKAAIGKLRMPDNLFSILKEQRIDLLNITADHAYAVHSLPRLHGDPFDRMLVAQAMLENLTIMTHDKHISAYSVPCILV